MTRTSAVLTGLLLAVGPQSVEAATFSSDMWVYELELTAVANDGGPFIAAYAEAPAGTPVPEDCEWAPKSPGKIEVRCSGNPGIDLMTSFTPEQAERYLTRSVTIGFNDFGVVCAGDLIIGCPPDGVDTIDGTWPPFGGGGVYHDVFLDAAQGLLSYCGFRVEIATACYSLSPERITGGGWLNFDYIEGFWDFGDGGYWSIGPDAGFTYAATGHLISAPPPVVPLPAPLLMLGSALTLLAVPGARGRTRRSSASGSP